MQKNSAAPQSINSTSDTSEQTRQDLLWLEEVESDRALDWVRERNQRTFSEFAHGADFSQLESKYLELLNAKDKIVFPAIRGKHVYNFWQDSQHVRGLWRRQSIEQYLNADKTWDVVIDFDQLAKDENKNWVFKGSNWFEPKYQRSLLMLSDGGKDAGVVREFDADTKTFVKGGFELPEAKSRSTWVDQDTLLVSTDFGPGSLTHSGYPRQIKILKRGQNLADAKLLSEAPVDYMSIGSFSSIINGKAEVFLSAGIDFYNTEEWYWKDQKELIPFPTPKDSSLLTIFKEFIVFTNRSEFVDPSSHKKFRQGSLLAFRLKDLADKKPLQYISIFEPDEGSSLQGATSTSDKLYFSIMKNVVSEIFHLSDVSSIKLERLNLPANGTASVVSSSDDTDELFVSFENFLQPTTLYYVGPDAKPRAVQSIPKRFDATNLVVKQEWVKSSDGVRIPYFCVHRRDLKLDGSNPTLLNGYGGFEISRTPYYLQTQGDAWLNAGGVYVLANIRGGGEFGPAWHQAALRENRQKAFDDFIAVAEDLIAKKITSADHLAIQGGSNGGLLVGAVYTQRPDLFKAVICQVPLLDMLRFHKLLAGASWVAEYGNPDIESDAVFLKRISPFHNLSADKNYPTVLFVTSTKDDRVHPGHARKMAALMESMNKPFYYYENIDGGHSAAANLKEFARRLAIETSFLKKELF